MDYKRSHRPGPANRIDTITRVTAQVLTAMEQGTIPWSRGYTRQSPWPRNASTGTPYHGLNDLILRAVTLSRGCSQPYWLTFNQASALGGTVKKGEHGIPLVYWGVRKPKQPESETQQDKEGSPKLPRRTGMFPNCFWVFNIDQTEGVESKFVKPIVTPEIYSTDEVLSRADAYFAKLAQTVPVRHTTTETPSYLPGKDVINMPAKALYENPARYFKTLAHEFAHSTGVKGRLNRYGTEIQEDGSTYAVEELVAEMSAMQICSLLGLDVDACIPNAAAYLKHWHSKIEADPKLLLQAAGRASKATDFLISLAPEFFPEDYAPTKEQEAPTAAAESSLDPQAGGTEEVLPEEDPAQKEAVLH